MIAGFVVVVLLGVFVAALAATGSKDDGQGP
ncbi:MAG: hypothetical protein ACI9WU_004280 [Myxococcota bacterium]|jgi:hypothetical protein